MSADEDTELRDLVAQTLETNGVLGKIRAQLRASVFLALEDQEQSQDKSFANPALKQYLTTKEGQAVAGLVREFLEYFNLDYTLAVFEPEAGLGPNKGDRQQLARELNILESDGPPKGPLLSAVVSGSKPTVPQTKASDELTPAQIAAAEQKFNYYDKNHSGDIDKNELRELFVDICPGFNRNMIERYVNEEFKATDTDFSSCISFEEFLGMYKRLFVQCKTVVSGEVSDLVNSHKTIERKEFVESRNQRNLQSNLNDQRKKQNVETDLLGGSDVEIEDPFFDDPVPHSSGLKGLGTVAETSVDSRRGMGARPSQIPVYSPLRSANSSVSSDSGKDGKPSVNGSGQGHSLQSSLSGLPNLAPSKTRKSLESEEENLRAMDRGMADLGLDGDFDYDDDFQSSGHSLTKSPHTISKSEQRSEQNGSIAEEIEEEIDDISIEADDLLRSERSGFDDMTTDRTISQQDGFDYVEDLQSPR